MIAPRTDNEIEAGVMVEVSTHPPGGETSIRFRRRRCGALTDTAATNELTLAVLLFVNTFPSRGVEFCSVRIYDRAWIAAGLTGQVTIGVILVWRR